MGILGFGKNKQKTGGAFSEYDSFDKVGSAVKLGILTPMYIMSPMFGGAEDESNILYVPPSIISVKEMIDNILVDALESGKSVNYSASPQYKGNSVVPSSIDIKVSGDVNINQTINIW